MNRKNKGPVKKIEFEPKIQSALPPSQAVETVNEKKIEERSKTEKEVVQMMKGLFAPRTFSNSKDFSIKHHGFAMQLPQELCGGSLVVYSDGSLGIRVNNTVYECDASYLGDATAVEVGEKIRKIGDVDFLLTGYEFKKAN